MRQGLRFSKYFRNLVDNFRAYILPGQTRDLKLDSIGQCIDCGLLPMHLSGQLGVYVLLVIQSLLQLLNLCYEV